MVDSGTWHLATSRSEFLDLRSDWEHVFRENPRHSPFLAWGWVNAWLLHVAGQHELNIACWRDASGALQFILPLISRDVGLAFRRKRYELVCSYGPECSEFLGCLCLPVHESRIAEISAMAIAHLSNPRQPIMLGCLDNAGDYPTKLKSAVQANGHTVRLSEDVVCPTVSMPGSWDEFLQQLSSNFRSQVRRHFKRMTAQEHVRFRTISESEAESFTRDLIRLNRSRISAKGEVSSLESEVFRKFLVDAIPYMASQGIAWMDIIEEDGMTLGSALNFVHGDSVYYYMGGFDEKAKDLRPGTVLFARVIQRSIDGGYADYNFLRGAESYKYRWGAKDVHTHQVVIYAHGVISGFLMPAIDGLGIATRDTLRRLRSLGKRQ